LSKKEGPMSKKLAKWLSFGSVTLAVMAFAGAVSMPVQARPPLNCKWVSCPPPACEYGEHMEVPPGQCCPVCVPD